MFENIVNFEGEMDEYDVLVISERIKNIFVEYLFFKDKLNIFYKCNKV